MSDTGGGNTRPSFQGEIAALKAEIRRLAVKTPTTNIVNKPMGEVIWSVGGVLDGSGAATGASSSPKWIAPFKLIITSITLMLQISGDDITTIVLYVFDSYNLPTRHILFANGYKIEANSVFSSTPLSIEVPSGGIIYIGDGTVAPGVNAVGLSVIVRYLPA